MGLIIDADTHVAESEPMWSLLEKEIHPRRPIMMQVPDDTLYGSSNAFWLIDGNIVPKPAGRGGNRLITPSASKKESSRTGRGRRRRQGPILIHVSGSPARSIARAARWAWR